MRIIWFPEEKENENETPGMKFLLSLEKERKDLFLRIKSFIKKVDEWPDFSSSGPFLKNEKIKKLADELYEIRIPPTGKGGVARLYFCLSNTKNALVILEGELKKKNKGKMVDQAKSNLVKLRKRESEDGQNKKR